MKFQVGDELLHIRIKCIVKVVNTKPLEYLLIFGEGNEQHFSQEYVEESYRKLTKLEKALK